jgi:hypothetical protein
MSKREKNLDAAKKRAEKTAIAIQKRKKISKSSTEEPAGLLSDGWDEVCLARAVREQKQEKE